MDVISKFERKDFDIVELLNSFAVVGMYRGQEVWSVLETFLEQASDGILVLVNVERANPLDYEFCRYAFGPLFEALNNQRWPHKYVMFQMHDFHRPGFFHGVLKHLNIEIPSFKESEKGFCSAGMYAKLYNNKNKKIDFIGQLEIDERKVCDVVNDMKKVTVRQVVEKSGLSEENVVYALDALMKKYFVVRLRNESDSVLHYYSFYNYF